MASLRPGITGEIAKLIHQVCLQVLAHRARAAADLHVLVAGCGARPRQRRLMPAVTKWKALPPLAIGYP